ncbi:helix-turn-helix domain-containing protein [Nitrosomonas ureae]|uniref:helix-turn-helix domain-containing protein n=1 Tax=Nitrosomonas ureae TaxID=44577 RepID=UPI000720A65D|nr:helix-turn-helix transcriptional regulator [Nitrosomonas ureae]ALQ52061.1 hypothetical protein ATY38_13055 [Nitrosomonas ureae]
MKNYIEKAERKAGKQTELANMLGITASYIRMVKAGKKGFPIETCIVLADYIGADRLEVIAASNLVTEKDEKKRKILESCFTRAASVTAAAIVISILTLLQTSPVYAGFKQSIYNNTNYTQLQAQEIQEE